MTGTVIYCTLFCILCCLVISLCGIIAWQVFRKIQRKESTDGGYSSGGGAGGYAGRRSGDGSSQDGGGSGESNGNNGAKGNAQANGHNSPETKVRSGIPDIPPPPKDNVVPAESPTSTDTSPSTKATGTVQKTKGLLSIVKKHYTKITNAMTLSEKYPLPTKKDKYKSHCELQKRVLKGISALFDTMKPNESKLVGQALCKYEFYASNNHPSSAKSLLKTPKGPSGNGQHTTEIMLINQDCFKVAVEAQKQGFNSVVLNYGNCNNAGGGWQKGSFAQEEHLVRMSSYILSTSSAGPIRQGHNAKYTGPMWWPKKVNNGKYTVQYHTNTNAQGSTDFGYNFGKQFWDTQQSAKTKPPDIFPYESRWADINKDGITEKHDKNGLIYSPEVLVLAETDYDKNRDSTTHEVQGDITKSPVKPVPIDRLCTVACIAKAAFDFKKGNAQVAFNTAGGKTHAHAQAMLKTNKVWKIMLNRFLAVLEVAKEKKHDVVVLGPIGCGVFANDPWSIAKIMEEAIKRYDGHFKHVFITNLCFTPKDTNCYKTFEGVFKDPKGHFSSKFTSIPDGDMTKIGW